jgi:signal transduction histidine kinase
MKGGSLRFRLLAAGGASILVALSVAALGLMLLFERHVERRLVRELESHLRQLVSGLERSPDNGVLRLGRAPAEPRFLEPLSGLYWQIAQRDGRALRSRSLWDAALDLPPDVLADGEVHQHTIAGPGGTRLLAVERAVALPETLGGGSIRAAVAIDRSEVHAAGLAFAVDLLPALAMLAAVLLAAAWVQVTVGLRPLDAVRRRLAQVRAGQQARLGGAFPNEVRALAAEVDRLLEAQEASIARARARAADLAHGLKTPLTVLAADAAELQARGQTQIGEEIAAIADGMRRHVERELARARAGIGRHAREVAVRPLVDQVAEVLRRTPAGQALAWQIDVPAELAVRLDAQDLTEILGNLGENAAQWARGTVRLGGRRDSDAVVLSVVDDGPGIPAEHIGAVLARGARLDESRPGSGLGLAIVKDLVEAYGGTLTLRSADPGLSAEIRIPVSA